jgi:hypothetical protein
MRTYGLNIIPQVNHDHCLAYLRRLRPSCVVVMSEHALARRIRRELPSTQVIYRQFRSFEREKTWHEPVTPEQWLALHEQYAVDGIILQVFNEPNGYHSDLRPLASWCAELMRLASARGVRLALPGWGLGHPDEDAIARGDLDGMLRAFGEGGDNGHVLFVHEYAVASMRAERRYHVGRYGHMLDRMTALGVRHPRVVIGEHGRDKEGKPGPEGDGWQRVMNDDEYVAFLQAGEDAYAGIARCLYCYSDANADWQTFNHADKPTVLAWLVARNDALERALPPVADEMNVLIEQIIRRLMLMIDNRIPIVGPILLALRSRKVIIALVSIAVAVLVAYVPELRAVQDALIVLIGSVSLAVIGGIAWEDAAGASRARAAQPVGTIAEEVKRAVREVLGSEFGG